MIMHIAMGGQRWTTPVTVNESHIKKRKEKDDEIRKLQQSVFNLNKKLKHCQN